MSEENKQLKKLLNQKNPKWTKRRKIQLVALISSFVILLALLFPLPYYLERPGTTENVAPMVEVAGKEDRQSGGFYLTTVAVSKASALTMLLAKTQPFVEIMKDEEVTGGASDAEYNRINQFYMENAQNTAIYEAFKLANKPFELKYEGVYVLDISDKSTFKDKLHVADTITKVNGKSFKSSTELIDYMSSQKVGDSVKISFVEDKENKEATGKIIKLDNGKSGIGITLTNHTSISSNPKATINAGSIGGPSAGLMFTLETYEQLTDENLRKGREIAGTGTIEIDGTVGRIGGIDKKVATADKSGAEIFFAPDDEITADMKKADPNIKTNYQEALAAGKKINTKMKIVPVKNVEDALKYLRKLK